MEIIIIGNKNYKFNNLNKLIDTFENNVRFNMSLPDNNNGTKYDTIMINNHIHDSLNHSLSTNIKKYNEKPLSIPQEHISLFYLNIKKYNTIKKQYYQNAQEMNNYLKRINCNHIFTHLPRVGYQYLINELIKGSTIFVIGFSLKEFIFEKHIYNNKFTHGESSNLNLIKNSCHNEETEIKILIWLHKNNYIDATLCMISNDAENTILLDCHILYPKLDSIVLILDTYNECYLKNHDTSIINNIISNNKKIEFDTTNNKLFYVV